MPMDHANMSQMDHPDPTLGDYLKFIAIINGIIAGALTVYVLKDARALVSFMTAFMGVFFVVFAAFKLGNRKDFAMSYFSYDLIAQKWLNWGYVYPFIELLLGIGYLMEVYVSGLNWITLVLTLIGSAGIIQVLSRKTKIRCACLGSFVNLPLSTVSLVEDLLMAVMAAAMLFLL